MQEKKHRSFSALVHVAGKAKRIKQAKDEAMVEVDQYRMQKDKEFRMRQSKVSKKVGTDVHATRSRRPSRSPAVTQQSPWTERPRPAEAARKKDRLALQH